MNAITPKIAAAIERLPEPQDSPLLDLPFVALTPDGEELDVWSLPHSVQALGPIEQKAVGREYADMMLALDPGLIPCVVCQISEKGAWSDVEGGFFNRIGEVLTSARHGRAI